MNLANELKITAAFCNDANELISQPGTYINYYLINNKFVIPEKQSISPTHSLTINDYSSEILFDDQPIEIKIKGEKKLAGTFCQLKFILKPKRESEATKLKLGINITLKILEDNESNISLLQRIQEAIGLLASKQGTKLGCYITYNSKNDNKEKIFNLFLEKITTNIWDNKLFISFVDNFLNDYEITCQVQALPSVPESLLSTDWKNIPETPIEQEGLFFESDINKNIQRLNNGMLYLGMGKSGSQQVAIAPNTPDVNTFGNKFITRYFQPKVETSFGLSHGDNPKFDLENIYQTLEKMKTEDIENLSLVSIKKQENNPYQPAILVLYSIKKLDLSKKSNGLDFKIEIKSLNRNNDKLGYIKIPVRLN